MRFKQITETTTSGSIATVSSPLAMQKRSSNLLTGKKTSKKYLNSLKEYTGDYFRVQVTTQSGEKFIYSVKAENEQDALKKVQQKVNKSGYDDFQLKVLKETKSIAEGKMKQIAVDIRDMDNGNFKKKYGKSKEQMKFTLGDPEIKDPHKAQLEEEDLIIAPGKGKKLKTGFHKQGEEKKLSQFKHPFKASGIIVSDSRGNKIAECENEDLAREVCRALNEYIKINEGVKRVGAFSTKSGDILKLLQVEHDPTLFYLINPKGEVVQQLRGTEEQVKNQIQRELQMTVRENKKGKNK
jgi:hypothetical protein